MKEAQFIVSGEPVPKARPRVVNGHAYTPARTKNHEAKIALVYKSIYHGDRFDKGVSLRVRTDFYRTIPKSARKQDKELMRSGRMRPTVKPDIDNLAKTVLDALLGVAYDDDNQVAELECKKFYSDEPRTEIFIEVVS